MDHHDYMKRALEMAKSGRGQTHPNPAVGAVVVKDGRIVGIGAHLEAGESHAEVHALTMAGEKAKSATLYVTLEPCSHQGRTPPCTDLIIEKGIRRVFIAVADPNPRVSRKGIEALRRAGIQVEVGMCKQEAATLNESFFHYIRTNTPFVTIKSATSLDGKTATVSGESQWITGEESRYDVHRYRDQTDAILVGVNTVISDDPSLTTRLDGSGKNPIRVVLDHHLRMPISANVVRDGEGETWIATTQTAAEKKGIHYEQNGVKVLPFSQRIEIQSLLKQLGAEGITSLFVEGGATVNGNFLKAGAVQKVITYLSPKLLGGNTAPTSFGGEGIQDLVDARELSIVSVEKVGADIKIVSQTRRDQS